MSKETPASDGYQLPEGMEDTLKRLGLAVPLWEREVSAEEIQYFIDRWLFLQLLSSNTLDPLSEPELVKANTNWTIINYGDALSSSPGEFLFGGGDFTIRSQEDDDDGGEGAANPGMGTIWAQAFNTVAEMVALAKRLGWEGLHLVDGHPMMKWAAWMHALDEGMSMTGFEPSERDIARRERVRRAEIEDVKRFGVSLSA